MVKKIRRSVPVAHRVEKTPNRSIKIRVRLGYLPLFITIIAIIVVLGMIVVPLRNYMEQRAEINRLHASISELNAKKHSMESEIERFQSEDYIREQARVRLGVIEPGEVAFRVVDPALENNRQTEDATNTADSGEDSWYHLLWNAITTPELLEVDEPEAPTENLPLAPDPNAEQLPVEQPPAEQPPAEQPPAEQPPQ